MIVGWIGLTAMALLGVAAPLQSGIADSSERVEVHAYPALIEVAPGGDLPLAIVLEIEPSWHVWTNDRSLPGTVAVFDGAVETEITASTAPSALRVALASSSRFITSADRSEPTARLFAQWPEFHTVTADVGDGPQTYAVFEGRTIVFVPISVSPEASVGRHSIDLDVSFQACDATICLQPATVRLKVEVDVRPGATAGARPEVLDVFKGFDPGLFAAIHGGTAETDAVQFDVFGAEFSIDPHGGGFLLLLLVAAIGGLLLNFTPCVLPVIPLKVMGLAKSAGNRARCAQLGAALSLGVIAFWMGLGLAVSLLSGFTSSQLFQYPLFTVALGVVIGAMAIGMCGLFSIQLPQSIAGIEVHHDTVAGSVGFGIMTAVLSTPCTAPLMGAAAAWAASQPPSTVLAVFASIGTGMALPYFVLSAFPKLVARVPRTGPASDLVKQTMGLLLLAAAAYFVGAGLSGWAVEPPNPPSHAYWWVVSALGVAAGGWLLWRSMQIARTTKWRVISILLGGMIAAVSAAVGVRLTDEGRIDWIYYTPERVASALASGDAVMLDFTAEWCLNCKTLESTVLESAGVLERLDAGGIAPIKVDLTGNNAAGRELLTKHDRLTIPLLVIIAPDGREVFKSDAYTPGQVEMALDEATRTEAAGGR
ncbi:MAG: hypothetical protein EXS03_04225 [Phycisphaerales bacterium]|nr:hypothetical protein [Phycisphaerales bacterium]